MAIVQTIGNENYIVKCNLEHNHDKVATTVLQNGILVTAAKRKAIEEINEQPSKIIRRVLSENPCTEICTNQLNNTKRIIYNARRKLLPPIPKTVLQVHSAVTGMAIKTNREEEFILHNDPNDKILIFSCITNLKFLCRSNTWYMDGTFDFAPQHFLQLFTIHGHINGHYIPAVFCLLQNKASDTYVKCFNILTSKCNDFGLSMQPNEIVVDFEKAIHNAINLVWPTSSIIGCRFHISQAWWRKVQQLGLSKDYKERTEAGKWIGYCFGLLFLGMLLIFY